VNEGDDGNVAETNTNIRQEHQGAW